MTERQINPQELEAKAQVVVARLKEVAANHERTYPSAIQAVLVFSGPGTYYEKLKPDQEEWMRWMDRDRIRAGVAVVREVTASKLSEFCGRQIRGKFVTKEDVLKFGPIFVYNGIPEENKVFRQALDSPFCKLPKEKVVIIDKVKEEDDGTTHPIRHTADQVKSFYKELDNPDSPLLGVHAAALVAHIPDFVRIPFYFKKYNDEFEKAGGYKLNFWIYGLKSRPGTEKTHTEWELPRLVKYAEAGHLATDPSSFSV